jgi:hypothetical protein
MAAAKVAPMIGRIALLLGLFAAPLFLLWAGHHWRHATPRMRGAFWGGITAHTLAALLATAAGVLWPVEWDPSHRWRGFFGFWAMLVLFVIGAVIGAIVNERAVRSRAASSR